VLPVKITNRLDLGRCVAASAPTRHSGCLAWVIVEPILHRERTIIEQQGYEFEALVRPRTIGENPIDHYILRYVEIPQCSYKRYIEYPLEWDYHLVVASYQRVSAQEATEIEETLAGWHVDGEALHIPGDVGFPQIGYHDNVLEEQSLARQLVTILRKFPKQTLFSFYMKQPAPVVRFRGNEFTSRSTMIFRKIYTGWIKDLKRAQIIFETNQKLKQHSLDRIEIRNLTKYLDRISVKFANEASWTYIEVQFDPNQFDLTNFDCYNPITYRWSSYEELLSS